MRVLVNGGGEQAARIAEALRLGGFDIAEADAPFDLMLTLDDDPQRLHLGDLVIDLASRRVARAGRRIHLTPIEFDLLAHLWRRQDVVSREELLQQVWGYSFDPGTNILAVHLSRLRAKVGREVIASVPGGYRINPRAAARPR